MKAEDFRTTTTRCAVCGRKLLEPAPDQRTVDLTFYRVRISRDIWDAGALTRLAGLSMAMGSETLASVMGPNEHLSQTIDEPVERAVHESCAGNIGHLLELTSTAAETRQSDSRE